MTFNDIEEAFLAKQERGHLATVAPDGTPQNKPLGFYLNTDTGTIDIYGFGMEGSAKFRNVQANPAVAFVVDFIDADGQGADGVHFLEIRGRAETLTSEDRPADYLSTSFIRIHPRRLVGFNVDPANPGPYARDV